MPEFGELPPAPEVKRPDWIPAEYEQAFREFIPDAQKEFAGIPEGEGRASLLKILHNQQRKIHWPKTLGDVEAGKGHVPKDMIDEVFDLDGKDHKYGRVWHDALIKHPNADFTADQLHKILNKPDFSKFTRARAYLHNNGDPNEKLPDDFTPYDFSYHTVAKGMGNVSDAKLASIVSSDKPSMPGQTYGNGTLNFIDRTIDSINAERHALPNKPLFLQAVANHPAYAIKERLYRTQLPDHIFNQLLEGTKPKFQGRDLTDEEKKTLAFDDWNSHIPSGPAGEAQFAAREKANQFQTAFWDENSRKADFISRLGRDGQYLTSGQIEKLVNHLDAIEASGIPKGLYENDSIKGKLANHKNITAELQTRLLSNPLNFAAALRNDKDIDYDSGGSQPPTIKPETFNALAKPMLERFSLPGANEGEGQDMSEYIQTLLDHKYATPELVNHAWDIAKKDINERGHTNVSTGDIIANSKTSPELKREIWNTLKTPSEAEWNWARRNGWHGGDSSKPYDQMTDEQQDMVDAKINDNFQHRNRRIAREFLRDHNLPHDFATDIIQNTDILEPEFQALKPEHHKMMFDKVNNSDLLSTTKEDFYKRLAGHTSDPDLIRQVHQSYKQNWDALNIPQAYKTGPEKADEVNTPWGKGGQLARNVSRKIEPFVKNPYTPSDVIQKIHEDFPDPELLEHQNFPQERLEHFANLNPEDVKSNFLDFHNRKKANELLSHVDPDKYSYQTNGPGRNTIPNYQQTKGRDFGGVEVKPHVAKLRVFRDKILEMDPHKGEISPKQLGNGPFQGGWKPVQEKNGNISAKKIQEYIDSQPSTRYNFEHESWGGAQRHSEHHQRVFKLNASTEHIKEMKRQGVYDAFKKLSHYSEEGGHPSTSGHTIGWVRYEHHQNKPLPGSNLKPKREDFNSDMEYNDAGLSHLADHPDHPEYDTVHDKPEAIHVDELQTDMGPNTIAKLKERPERAKDLGVNPEHIEKVNKIVFGNHHPSEVLMEAFRQHHRDQGHHDKPIHILEAQTKAPISGMEAHNKENPLPAHMQFTYHQMPKKMGFQPNKYGASAQQDNPKVKPTPGSIWTDKIRKFEEELINKALGDIKLGQRTADFPRKKQEKLPEHVGFGKNNWFDYNHLLNPQQRKAGYQIYVNHVPDSKIKAQLFHRGEWAGDVEATINPYNSERLRISTAHVTDKHRGKGLGTALYEAMLGHARHNGFSSVYGGVHSSMAHAVHNKLREKHGIAYRALPNYMEHESTVQNWPDEESWSATPDSPYDDKFGRYEYMLKKESDSPFRAAGFKHKESGQVIETGTLHDVGVLPEEYDPEKWIDGFIDFSGVFHDREQAKKLLALSMKKHHEEWQDVYKNEDGILAMLEQDDPEERILALKSDGVGPHHILIAINDVDPNVRAFAATHKLINGPLLTECLRQCKSPDTFNLLLGHESADDTHMNYALETNWGGNGGPEDDGEPL